MSKIPTICLIPSGYKATKIYSVLPVNGNGDFTFDRGTSTAQTRVNKNGLIEDVAQDVPRLDYLDGGCPSLLLEPATTNLITYSEDFSNVAWIKENTTVTADAVLSPDGSVNADKLVQNSSNSYHSVYFDTGVLGFDRWVFSVFVRKAEATKVAIADRNAGNQYACYNLDNGTLIEKNLVDTKIISYNNNWYRIEINPTSALSIFQPIILILQDSYTSGVPIIDTYLGDGVSGIYIYGAQFEVGSSGKSATSYVRSLAGVSGVRNAETCNGAGTTAEINSQEGVLFAEIRALADDLTFRNISLSNGTSNVVVTLRYRTTTNKINILIKDAINPNINESFDLVDITDYSKFALKYKSGEISLFSNGLEVLNLSDIIALSGLNDLSFDSGSGGDYFYGRVKKLSVYDSALNDLELETLTGFGSFSEMASYLSYS